jgi:hypothetical protein
MAFESLKSVAVDLYGGLSDFVEYMKAAVNSDGKPPFGEVVLGTSGAVFGTPSLILQFTSHPKLTPLEAVGSYALEAIGIIGYGMLFDHAFLNSGLLAYAIGVPKEKYYNAENKN